MNDENPNPLENHTQELLDRAKALCSQMMENMLQDLTKWIEATTREATLCTRCRATIEPPSNHHERDVRSFILSHKVLVLEWAKQLDSSEESKHKLFDELNAKMNPLPLPESYFGAFSVSIMQKMYDQKSELKSRILESFFTSQLELEFPLKAGFVLFSPAAQTQLASTNAFVVPWNWDPEEEINSHPELVNAEVLRDSYLQVKEPHREFFDSILIDMCSTSEEFDSIANVFAWEAEKLQKLHKKWETSINKRLKKKPGTPGKYNKKKRTSSSITEGQNEEEEDKSQRMEEEAEDEMGAPTPKRKARR